MELGKLTTIRMAEIDRQADTQARATFSTDTCAEYERLIRDAVEAGKDAGKLFPPIDVFFDKGRYCIGDGWHRFEAYDKANFEFVEVRLYEGDERTARIFACAANRKHGMQRTPADRRLAVTRMLQDHEWVAKSDRMIADHCGVDHKTVGKVRHELFEAAAETAGEFPTSSPKRTGKDGKEYDAAKLTSREGPSRKREAAGSGPSPDSAAPAGKKSGKEKVAPEVRKEAKRAFGEFVRGHGSLYKLFEAVGWMDVPIANVEAGTVRDHLGVIEDRLNEIAESLKGVWGR